MEEATTEASTQTPTTPTSTPTPSPKPFTLSQSQITRVHTLVKRFLTPDFDRDYIADTIILKAWLYDIHHISSRYIKHQCISAWRSQQRERKHNEAAVRAGLSPSLDSILSTHMIVQPTHNSAGQPSALSARHTQDSEIDDLDRKTLVHEAIGKLSAFERKLIWMRFFAGQTLDEMSTMIPLRRDEIQQALKVAIYKMRVHLS